MTPRLNIAAIALNLALPMMAPAALAQSDEPPPAETDEGLDLIERGIGLLLENFLTEVAPQMDIIGNRMAEGLGQLGPALNDLGTLIDDISNYQAPERLENGDILIRRKAGAPPPPAFGESAPPDLPGFVDPDLPQIEL